MSDRELTYDEKRTIHTALKRAIADVLTIRQAWESGGAIAKLGRIPQLELASSIKAFDRTVERLEKLAENFVGSFAVVLKGPP